MQRKTLLAMFIIGTGTVLSAVFGFLREAALAANFGATATTDAYLVASAIPLSVLVTLTVGFNTAIVPVYSHKLLQSRAAALRMLNSVINLSLLILSLVTIPTYIFMPQLLQFYAPGFPPNVASLTVELTRLMLPTGFLWAISAMLQGVLQAERRFTLQSFVGLPQNLVLLVGIYVFAPRFGVHALAYASILGTMAQYLFILPDLRRVGYRYEWVLDLRDDGLRQMLRMSWPILLATVVSQFGDIVFRAYASTLTAGTISALNFASKLFQLPFTVVVLAITTVLFPIMATAAAQGDKARFHLLIARAVEVSVYLMIPVAVLFVMLGEQIVGLLFGHGRFTTSDISATSYALTFYSLGLSVSALLDVIQKAAYAVKDSMAALVGGMTRVACLTVFSALLIKPLAHGGLALATVLAALAALIVQTMMLRRKSVYVRLGTLLRPHGLALVAGFGMYAVMRGLAHVQLFSGRSTSVAVLNLIVLCLAGLLTYAALLGPLLGITGGLKPLTLLFESHQEPLPAVGESHSGSM